MKLLIDLSNHKNLYSGVTIYALRILQGFQANQYSDIIILCNTEIYEHLRKMYPQYSCIRAYESRQKGLWSKIQNIYYRSKQINNSCCNVVFSPALSPTICSIRKKKIVQTIHDLQALKVTKGITKCIMYLYLLLSIVRCHKIITISDFVKSEIHRVFPFVSTKKIQTIYNSVVLENLNSNEFNINDNYILFVGLLKPYKNILTLIKAYNLIKNNIHHKLIIIGKPIGTYWENVIQPYIKQNGLSSRIVHISNAISNQMLIKYYKHADLLVHPSLLEGFGYTPIEAAILKTPVLTTKETALYETTLGLLNYYTPPTDEKILAEKIMYILNNPPTNSQLDNISKILSKEFDYCSQAKKVYQYIYNN